MRYTIQYSCCSHTGHVRSINQDNYICNGQYSKIEEALSEQSFFGSVSSGNSPVFGVFDGMGGEECGEIASFIAAKCAAEIKIGNNLREDLLLFCKKANDRICNYVLANDLSLMGTTAAILLFSNDKVALCNIGDSKVFYLTDHHLRQISVDHYAVAAFGRKPPLSQNLGISESEMIIDPYVADGKCGDEDTYLICSDGLTDMLTTSELEEILDSVPFNRAADSMLSAALERGGKDNITIIICKLTKESQDSTSAVSERKISTDTKKKKRKIPMIAVLVFGVFLVAIGVLLNSRYPEMTSRLSSAETQTDIIETERQSEIESEEKKETETEVGAMLQYYEDEYVSEIVGSVNELIAFQDYDAAEEMIKQALMQFPENEILIEKSEKIAALKQLEEEEVLE